MCRAVTLTLHALNAHAVTYADLPPKFALIRTSRGNIPAANISMFGVDQRFAGRGYGGDLLVDAQKRIARDVAPLTQSSLKFVLAASDLLPPNWTVFG